MTGLISPGMFIGFFSRKFVGITTLFAVQDGEFKSIVVSCGQVENKRNPNETPLRHAHRREFFFLFSVLLSPVFVNLNSSKVTFFIV